MKKKLLVLLLAGLVSLTALSCQKVDAESTRYKAMVRLPDGPIVEGDASDWRSYSNGIGKVTIDGVSYTTSWQNICVIEE